MSRTIAIALSGGVDSLVSAHLLKENGYRVIGLHFLTGFEPMLRNFPDSGKEQARHKIQAYKELKESQFAPLAKQLDIPFEVVDLSREFAAKVIAYFVHTYASGLTPNPCLACNPAIKFGRLLEHAGSKGASCLATGHYARIKTDDSGGIRLLKGVDPDKDQSYFLARLTPEQLKKAVFPLGEFTKTETKSLARKVGLSPVVKAESQDICFIDGISYHEFLSQHLDKTPEPGPIVDTSGNLIGHHQGLHRFTIGQRRGINCPGPEPYYVIHLDIERNRLMVGLKDDLLIREFHVSDINWIINPPFKEIDIQVRVRYRHQAVAAKLTPVTSEKAVVKFEVPQTAVTPGQGAVFYQSNQVLGGGWINRMERK